MLHFDSDYMESVHPEIIDKIQEINFQKLTGYGFDSISEEARNRIRVVGKCPDADIYFLSGGTQTNSVAIKSLLRPYEGVICADTGHINGHEAGAIEAGGHKVISLQNALGKLKVSDIDDYMSAFYADATWPHMVKPAMVYISQPTEFGTLYSSKELLELRAVCDKYNMYLYADGARLGYALGAEENDVSIATLAHYCDAFYIGGTKVGALFGEALVFPKKIVDSFFTITKQNGALLAKGWSASVSFYCFFENDLYKRCGKNGTDTALFLKEAMTRLGYKTYIDSPTNQQFFIVDNEKIKELQEKVTFNIWCPYDENSSVIRLVTSWATTRDQIEELLQCF